MTWLDFVDVFNKKYYSAAILAAKEDEFMNLRQNNLTVTEYARQFDRLAKFAQEIAPTEALRVKRKALEAELLENDIKKENVAKREARRNNGGNQENKRKHEGNHGNDRDKKGKAVVQNNNNGVKRTYVEFPICPTCNRKHLGECKMKSGVCYNCGQLGHLKKNCPKGQKKENQAAPARVFALTRGEAATSNTVVSGQVSIYGLPCNVLFDSGATHSYIATRVIDSIDKPCDLLRCGIVTELPSGETMLSTRRM
ncbi:uncharacterized protein LOC133034178 [Cannabis sativa]|uniref:uncharacterized protein LOC133034178 n=1 Tax=Cannabis sativa TaxID=3483 RepID=UPI0029C9F1E5|nr:uncharacterized protein LOC133034178 [Cannabis sativa]